MFQNEGDFVPGRGGVWLPALVELKPSQALRIGAALRPQCFQTPFRDGGSCALGAMYEGCGRPYTLDHQREVSAYLRKRFPHLYQIGVYKKNDFELWTREQIADWLEAQGQ